MEQGFSLSPAIKGQLDWVGNVLKFRVDEQPQSGQEVTVALEYPGLADGAYRFSFKRQAASGSSLAAPSGSGFAANVMEHRYWEGTGNAPVHDVRDEDTVTVAEGIGMTGKGGVARLRSAPGGQKVLAIGEGDVLFDPVSGQSVDLIDSYGWNDSFPSPDGTRVAFRKFSEGRDEIYNTVTGKSVPFGPGIIAGWTPNGERVIYVTPLESNPGGLTGEKRSPTSLGVWPGGIAPNIAPHSNMGGHGVRVWVKESGSRRDQAARSPGNHRDPNRPADSGQSGKRSQWGHV